MFLGEHLADDFGNALAGTHHAGRIHRLVGRDQHETFGTVADCLLGDRERGERVIAERLAQLVLQQRHVFVGGGVEHALRFRERKRVGAGGTIAAIADQAAQQQLRILRVQFLFDAVEVVLGQVQDRELGGAEACDLAAQFRTDRTAAAGDQHALAGEAAANRVPLQLHRIAAEQVLDRDFLQFVELGASGHHVVESRHGAERQARGFAKADHVAHFILVGRRHRNQQHFGADPAREFRQPVSAAQYRYAVQARTAQ